MIERKILNPQRIRKIQGSFAFIEHRFLRDGFFSSLTTPERLLYLFLVMAADQSGISWYSYDRICAMTGITLDEYVAARNGLIRKDLIAFDGRIFQVLSLPQEPVPPAPEQSQAERLAALLKRVTKPMPWVKEEN